MVRIVVLLSLGAAVAAAFDSNTILNAKLQAGRGGFPCSVQGSVTTRLNPEEFYIQDATSGVRVSSSAYELSAGDRLEIEGWMYLDDSSEFQLRATRVWHLGNGPPLAPRLITLSDAYSGAWQGQLVGVRGVVLNVDFGPRFDTISIRHGRTSIRVFYAANHSGISAFERIYPGMQVAVTGISVPPTADPEFDGYQVRLRDPADLAIRPSPDGAASPRREWAGGMAAVLFIGAAAWVWTSRQRRPPPASQLE